MSDTDPPQGDPSSSPRPTGKRFLWKISIVLVTLVVAISLVELAFKHLPDRPWYDRVVEAQFPKNDGVVLGIQGERVKLRRVPDRSPKAEGHRRIMFLGDSFTYGIGLANPADTFVSRIGLRLNRDRPDPNVLRYEVCNAGAPGSLTNTWRLVFDVFAPAYEPDLVVAVFFLRDGVEGLGTTGQIRAIRAAMQRFADQQTGLYRISHTVRYFMNRRELARVSRKALDVMVAGYVGSESETAEWRRAQENLLYLRDQIESRGGRFAMVVFPMLYELDGTYPLQRVCDEIERFARDNEIPVHSLLPTFRGMDASSLWVSIFDQHPNARGHEIAADSMYEFLVPLIPTGE